jgi:hypothetical protein
MVLDEVFVEPTLVDGGGTLKIDQFPALSRANCAEIDSQARED